jgi:DNA repair protein RadD
MIASMVTRILARHPDKRILILCHQGHLLAQNEEKILALDPTIPTGVFCAGQGRKERQAQVVLASRDSLGRNPLACGLFEFVICDEAHMIPLRIHQDKGQDKDTHYGRIFRTLEPAYVIGLTGTPWRNKNVVIFGKGRFFEKLGFNIPMRKLIDDGYLCPYVFPSENVSHIDVGHLEVGSTGDYKIGELESVTNNETLVVWILGNFQQLVA